MATKYHSVAVSKPKHLYTTSYEGQSIDGFLERLRQTGVRTLVDVRELPLSRKAGFSKRALAEALTVEGIAYAHMPQLGCPKSIRDRYKADGNWARYTLDFDKYLATQTAAVTELAHIAGATTTALLCFEADFNRCHRTFVARAAAAAGAPSVAHITARTTISELPRRAAA
jgi:uncharacterized protein (DUF488 family)